MPDERAVAQTRVEPANGLVLAAMGSALAISALWSWSGPWTRLSVLVACLFCGLPWVATVLLVCRRAVFAGIAHLVCGAIWLTLGMFSSGVFFLVPIGMFFLVLGAMEL